MVSKALKPCLLFAFAALLASGATAQPNAALSGCTTALMSLSPCVSFTNGSSTRPSVSCCSALASAVQTSPQCLCSVLSTGAGSTLGVAVNQTLARALPRACNMQTVSVGLCDGAAGSPAPSATPTAVATPSVAPLADSPATVTPTDQEEPEAPSPDFPADSGSKTVPATGGNTSDSAATNASLCLLVVALSVVYWTALQ